MPNIIRNKMKELQNRLEELLSIGLKRISKYSNSEMIYKVSPEKWSKKEILGHLIDSGINNLQRFTEIQLTTLPYKIRTYSQNGLVNANDYQNSETKELLEFWKAINNRILYIFNLQTEESLKSEITFDNDETSDLKFLIEDYVNHLEHHLNQILD